MTEEQDLIEFVTAQRWYGSKTRVPTHASIVDRATLRDEPPRLDLVLLSLVYETGTHDTYQLLTDDSLDALGDPRHIRELVHMIRTSVDVDAGEGRVEFRAVEGSAALGTELAAARVVQTEQSNTSVVFDDELILKVFRRLEPGVNPELEMLRFLTERGFENIAPLAGWYAYTGAPMDATLGVLQRYIPHAEDGWEMTLADLETTPYAALPRLRQLGSATGRMHTTLGRDPSDPTFAPEEPSAEALSILRARVEEEIEWIFRELPPDNEMLDPIRGRHEEVRERLGLLSHVKNFGKIIRTHGDYHLGQTLWAQEDWVILDFEGEPARSLPERRRKRSPLRDVAGMLRSFAYAVAAAEQRRGTQVPLDWEQRARTEFLAGYEETVERTLIPPGAGAVERVLTIFELEKAVYELRYELNHRPDWIGIPVAAIANMLEAEVV